jgi:hypothetical protein
VKRQEEAHAVDRIYGPNGLLGVVRAPSCGPDVDHFSRRVEHVMSTAIGLVNVKHRTVAQALELHAALDELTNLRAEEHALLALMRET